jgi:hypothetical protein
MSFLIHESADEYHAKTKHYLSSHQLADFRKCPQLYYRKKYQRHTQEESPAYLVGRAAHVLILEGLERFREDFAVGGPINIKTGLPFGPATKAWTQWAESVGKPVLSDFCNQKWPLLKRPLTWPRSTIGGGGNQKYSPQKTSWLKIFSAIDRLLRETGTLGLHRANSVGR